MHTNLNSETDDLVDELMMRAVAQTVEETRDAGLSGEQFSEYAVMRYEELTMPYRTGLDDFFAQTIQASLIEVAERSVVSDGADPFSVEKVVDESMAKLERAFGPPEDPQEARTRIHTYILDAHSLTRAGSAGRSTES